VQSLAIAADATLREIIDTEAVTSVYQPIVDLDSGHVVAYEALARGPVGTRYEAPDRLFAAAEAQGLIVELDLACQAAALGGALEAGLGQGTQLFLNVEPSSLAAPGVYLSSLAQRAGTALNVVVEVNERALVRDPASLIRALTQVRSFGMGVALDDVGAEPASLALLPFVAPDVIKLDMRLVRQHTDSEVALIIGAVHADAECRGATILAEGIETDEHLQRALVFGAQLGQGWLYGRPGPLPAQRAWQRSQEPRTGVPSQPASITPWSLVANKEQRRLTRKRFLIGMSHYMEQRALAGDPCVVVSAFQHARNFTPATVHRYEHLAAHGSMVGALAVDMPSVPGVGVRGGTLNRNHPLAGEWTVTVVGPHDAAALIARECGDPGADSDRRFEYVITHDRPTVVAAARSLIQYIDAT